jgi:hypothetical protein
MHPFADDADIVAALEAQPRGKSTKNDRKIPILFNNKLLPSQARLEVPVFRRRGAGNKELPASDHFSGGRFFVTCFKFYIF